MPTGRGLGLAALPAAKPVPEPEDRPGRLVIPTGRGVRLAALPPALAATPQPATQPQPVHHGDIARRLAELLEEREAEERETEASSTKRWRWPWRRNTHPELPADPTPTPAPAPTPAVVPVTPTPAPAPAPTVTAEASPWIPGHRSSTWMHDSEDQRARPTRQTRNNVAAKWPTTSAAEKHSRPPRTSTRSDRTTRTRDGTATDRPRARWAAASRIVRGSSAGPWARRHLERSGITVSAGSDLRRAPASGGTGRRRHDGANGDGCGEGSTRGPGAELRPCRKAGVAGAARDRGARDARRTPAGAEGRGPTAHARQ